jgi:hypothetical protein
LLESATALAVMVAWPAARAWMEPDVALMEAIVESDEIQRTPSLADDAHD